MKGKSSKGCYKKGGGVSSGPSFDEMKPKSGKGSMPKKVHGVSPKARLDKRARGGAIGSPLSGAMPKGLSSKTGENN